MRRRRRGRKRRENNKIVEEGIITLRRDNNEIEGKYLKMDNKFIESDSKISTLSSE